MQPHNHYGLVVAVVLAVLAGVALSPSAIAAPPSAVVSATPSPSTPGVASRVISYFASWLAPSSVSVPPAVVERSASPLLLEQPASDISAADSSAPKTSPTATPTVYDPPFFGFGKFPFVGGVSALPPAEHPSPAFSPSPSLPISSNPEQVTNASFVTIEQLTSVLKPLLMEILNNLPPGALAQVCERYHLDQPNEDSTSRLTDVDTVFDSSSFEIVNDSLGHGPRRLLTTFEQADALRRTCNYNEPGSIIAFPVGHTLGPNQDAWIDYTERTINGINYRLPYNHNPICEGFGHFGFPRDGSDPYSTKTSRTSNTAMGHYRGVKYSRGTAGVDGTYWCSIHRMVAFIWGAEVKTAYEVTVDLQVDHIDAIATNFRANNLQLVTGPQNNWLKGAGRLGTICNGRVGCFGESQNLPVHPSSPTLGPSHDAWCAYTSHTVNDKQCRSFLSDHYAYSSLSPLCFFSDGSVPVFSPGARAPGNLYMQGMDGVGNYPQVCVAVVARDCKWRPIHRCVAFLYGAPICTAGAFSDNLQVDHINEGDARNFNINNLQFLTSEQNGWKNYNARGVACNNPHGYAGMQLGGSPAQGGPPAHGGQQPQHQQQLPYGPGPFAPVHSVPQPPAPPAPAPAPAPQAPPPIFPPPVASENFGTWFTRVTMTPGTDSVKTDDRPYNAQGAYFGVQDFDGIVQARGTFMRLRTDAITAKNRHGLSDKAKKAAEHAFKFAEIQVAVVYRIYEALDQEIKRAAAQLAAQLAFPDQEFLRDLDRDIVIGMVNSGDVLLSHVLAWRNDISAADVS
jgi:hypothetical protein